MINERTFQPAQLNRNDGQALDLPLDAADPAAVANNVAIAFRLAPLFLNFPLVAGGYFRRIGTPDAFAAVDASAAHLGAMIPIELPEAHRARAAVFIVTMIGGGALHTNRLRQRAGDFDAEERDRLLAGNLLPGAWHAKAKTFRR